MKKQLFLILLLLIGCVVSARNRAMTPALWPDGTPMDAWFSDTAAVDLSRLGKQYRLTDNGIFADGTIHTEAIQRLIDRTDLPKSYADHITMRRCTMTVGRQWDILEQPDQYELTHFVYEQLNVTEW